MGWREVKRLDGVGGKGIFAVKNNVTGKVLICATTSLARRLYDHRTWLASGKHHNPGVQRDLDTYGAGSFSLYVVKQVFDSSHLRSLKYRFVSDAIRSGTAYDHRPVFGSKGNAHKNTNDEDATKASSATAALSEGTDGLANVLKRLSRVKRMLGDIGAADVNPDARQRELLERVESLAQEVRRYRWELRIRKDEREQRRSAD